jgi:hypothetical protein
VVIGFTGGIVSYFELNSGGELVQIGKGEEKSNEVCALELGPSDPGKMSRFLAVALSDRSVQLISLSAESRF